MITGIVVGVILGVLLLVAAVVVVVVLRRKNKKESYADAARASTFAVEIDGGKIDQTTTDTDDYTVGHESL